jgi:transcriptional regulator with XRE-family HTH domain
MARPVDIVKQFPTFGSYRLHLAKVAGFHSVVGHETHLLKKQGLPLYADYLAHLLSMLAYYKNDNDDIAKHKRDVTEELNGIAKKNGYSDWQDYCSTWAVTKGYSSWNDYKKARLLARGIASESEHKAVLAKQKGFKSVLEYEHDLAKKRQHKPLNQMISNIIMNRLHEMGESPAWLAQKSGIHRNTVYTYCQGLNVPKKDKLLTILRALQIPEKDIMTTILTFEKKH